MAYEQSMKAQEGLDGNKPARTGLASPKKPYGRDGAGSDSDDNSAWSASDDNLEPEDLFAKVYMQRKDTI